MKLRYIYSACVCIEGDQAKIVSDPWFTQGAFDGSWYQYPRLQKNAVEVIGRVDAIYISHIHPDHYDPMFLREYLSCYSDTPIIIGKFDPPFLLNKMRIDGFKPEVVDGDTCGDLTFRIARNRAYNLNIDSAMAVTDGYNVVYNMNDNPFDEDQVQELREIAPQAGTSMLLAPFTGAGPYPQTYIFDSETEQLEEGAKKKQDFFDRFKHYIDAFEPDVVLPFAGKYWLAGPLSRLNPLRGVSDPVEAIGVDPERVIVLEDGGQAYYDLDTRSASALRAEPYDNADIDRVIAENWAGQYDYEIEINPKPDRQLPIAPLLVAATVAATRRIKVEGPHWFCFKTYDSEQFLCVNPFEGSALNRRESVEELTPRTEIYLDARYLFGLLTRLYHWNNAEIGSHYMCRRMPNVYHRSHYNFLSMLHV